MKSRRDLFYDFERTIAFDFCRATEAAALNATPWLGRGEPEKAEAAAADAVSGMFDLMNICGQIGVSTSPENPDSWVQVGGQLGTWLPGTTHFELAICPLDGKLNVAKGMPNAISCLAASGQAEGSLAGLATPPFRLVTKLTYGSNVIRYMERKGIDAVDIRQPIGETLVCVARAVNKRVQDVVVQVMDDPRHDRLIAAIREAGATLRLMHDGEIAAAIAPALPDSEIDLYAGIGGAREAVLTAAAMRCLGGDQQCMVFSDGQNPLEKTENTEGESFAGKIFFADDLAPGRNILFCASGISDSPLLPGVRIKGNSASTHSVLMRAKSRTVRFIQAHHDLELKTIRLRSDRREHRI